MKSRRVSANTSKNKTSNEEKALFVGMAEKAKECVNSGSEVYYDSKMEINKSEDKLIESADDLSSQTFYHGTKADLKPGDLIEPGFSSNYGQRKKAKYIYLTATLDAAIWGCELALGEERERIYIVEPTGEFEDDPNLTDKKFPGNPTKSYRSLHPLRVISEITDWQGHSPEQLKAMKDHLEKLKELGIEAIED